MTLGLTIFLAGCNKANAGERVTEDCTDPLTSANFTLRESEVDTLSNNHLVNPSSHVDSAHVVFYRNVSPATEGGLIEVTQAMQSFDLEIVANAASCLDELDSIKIEFEVANSTTYTNTPLGQPFVNEFTLSPGYSWVGTSEVQSNGNLNATVIIKQSGTQTDTHLNISGGLAVIVITIDPAASVTSRISSAAFKLDGSETWETIEVETPGVAAAHNK